MKKLLLMLVFILSATFSFAQRSATLLDKGWKFTRGDDALFALRETDDGAWETVTVPHDWAIAGPFDMSIDEQRVTVVEDGEKVPLLRTGRSGALPWIGAGWYRKIIPAALTARDSRHTLQFDGAMSNAEVFVNGKKAGGWPYGYSSFEVDITDYLDYGGDNIIAVRLENKPQSSRWYPGAGIYRNVRLVSTGKVYIPMWGTYVTTPEISPKAASVHIKTTIECSGYAGKVKLKTEIIDGDGKRVAGVSSAMNISETGLFGQKIRIKNPRLWSVGSPDMYLARSYVYVNGKLADVYETPFGIRSIRFDADRGFFLNDKLVKIQGVCQHHDLGPLGAAVNTRALERQIEILKEMGCNAIRMSHNPPAPELLDLCDRMGMLVMDESFDEWRMAKNANGYNALFDEWAEKDMVAMIRRDRNHPSVIMWSIGNEIREQNHKDGAATARFLADICRREDPTRPVTAGLNNWDNAIKNGFTEALDVFGFNYKPFAYEQVHRDYPDLPLLGAETASTVSSRGVYHLPAEETRIANERFELWPDYQCSSYDLLYPRWASTPDTEFEAQADHDFVMGEFVWTGFDYLGEPTPYNNLTPARSSYFGIVDLVGMKKDRFYLYQSMWSDSPALHILPHWNWEGREGEPIPVHCYTNYDRVELFLNGRSLGVKSKNPAEKYQRFRIVWEGAPYEPGELKAVAYDSSGRAVAETSRHTAGRPARLLAEPDRTTIAADGKDLTYVEITVVDDNGIPCPHAAVTLNFEVSGDGSLEALCNGDATSHESFKGASMKAFSGKCMAILRSSEKAGRIALKISSPELAAAEVVIETTE